jgi:hypothetical protein
LASIIIALVLSTCTTAFFLSFKRDRVKNSGQWFYILNTKKFTSVILCVSKRSGGTCLQNLSSSFIKEHSRHNVPAGNRAFQLQDQTRTIENVNNLNWRYSNKQCIYGKTLLTSLTIGIFSSAPVAKPLSVLWWTVVPFKSVHDQWLPYMVAIRPPLWTESWLIIPHGAVPG